MRSFSLRPGILDRYILREMVPPTGLGLLVFTFVLLINEIPRLLGILVARRADLYTIFRVFMNLLPSIFAITIPMAFLLGVLLAFGRLASDSEIVALRATGVSPLRLIGPVLILSLVTGLLTFYINAIALPAANQAHRELVFSLVVTKARTVVKPRTFTDELLPGRMMLYVSDISAETGDWKNVFIHDSRDPDTPKVILASTGRLVINTQARSVAVHLGPGTQHTFSRADPAKYEESKFEFADLPLPFEEFFPHIPLAKGDREMTLPELQAAIREAKARGKPPREYARFAVEWQKKFAIPTACLVFGLLGLGLSLGSRKEARSAAFALAIAVIFIYYVFLRMGEQAGDNGMVSPLVAMWTANIVLGVAGIALLALNHREAAFDPLDPSHYMAWIPRIRRASATPAPSARPLPGRPVVVLRIPRLSAPFALLDRYIARSYLGHFLLVLGGFTSIFTLAEFLDLFNDIQENKVRGVVVMHFYAYHILAIINLVAPVAILVGVLVTFGVLARRNEITAMKAGGISIYRAAAPLLGVGVFLSFTLYSLQEFVLPYTNRVAALDFNVIKGRPPQSSGLVDRRWILASDNNLYNYDYLLEGRPPVVGGLKDPGRRVDFALFGLSIYDVDSKSWGLRERVYSSRAVWDASSETYELERGWRRSLLPQKSFRTFDLERVRGIGRDPGGEIDPPHYFRREEKPSDTLGFAELRAHIASLEAMGFDTVPLQVQLQRKLAFPAVGLIMTVLGIPFSFTVARRGALYGIGASVVIAIIYWACLGIFEALGNNALLLPILAAWAPNLLFGAAGLYLLLTLET